MDIKESLDTSFGDGPAQPRIEQHLEAGRRALRRRRAANGVTALAVAGLIGGTAWLVTPGNDATGSPGGDQVATAPSESASTPAKAKATKKPYRPSRSDFLGEPATIRGGEAFLAKGWREIARIENPMNYAAPNNSLAIEVRRGTEHKFVLMVEQPGDYGPHISVNSSDAVGTLAAWVPGAVASQRSLDEDNGVTPEDDDQVTGPLVTMDEDGTLKARPGLSIVTQQNDIDLGSRFAGPHDATAAARVDLPTGPDVYVLVRRVDDQLAEVIRGGNAGTFATLDAFLAHARTEYAGDSNAGLR